MGHLLFFEPGVWLGEGTIAFGASHDVIKFYTKWQIEKTGDTMHCHQAVEMQNVDQKTINAYTVRNIDDGSFEIELTNEVLKEIKGKGSFNQTVLSWEFNIPDVFVGQETYEKMEAEPNLYSFHAEYASEELFRTIIDGIIWKTQSL